MFLETGEMEKILRNAPIRVYFTGMRGDTGTMQRNGWEFAVNCDTVNMGYRLYYIAARHKTCGLYMMSNPFELNHPSQLAKLEVGIMACSSNITINIPMSSRNNFQTVTFGELPVDMYDRFETEYIDIGKYIPFTPNNAEAELFVPKKELWTVEKHLKAIKEMQAPFQAELRDKKRKQDRRAMERTGERIIDPVQDVAMKIITVA